MLGEVKYISWCTSNGVEICATIAWPGLLPTTEKRPVWILAINNTDRNFQRPVKHGGGCFLIFRPVDTVDNLWTQIENATYLGNLGYESSVSSYGENAKYAARMGIASADYVICVKTRDAKDSQDRLRIEGELESMGILDTPRYKTQKETMAGIPY